MRMNLANEAASRPNAALRHIHCKRNSNSSTLLAVPCGIHCQKLGAELRLRPAQKV